jgi:outer membrane receptor for ferrienterochelin and colicins
MPAMKRPLGALFGLLLGLAAAPAAAQDDVAGAEAGETDELEELDLVRVLNVEVSTATKTSESLDEAPAVITVVTREDIRRWGYRTVAEVLTHTLGFYLIDDHVLPNAGVRGVTGGLGAESSMIKVMIDGRSVAYRTTSGNWLGTELVPLESVEQIEIIRGPASALYGADAFLGVVNVITRTPDELRPVQALARAGVSGGNPAGSFDAVGSMRAGNFDFMLGAAGELADRSGLELPAESPAPTLPADLGTRRTALNLERRSLVLQSRVGYRDPKRYELVLSGYASGLERGGDFAHWAQLTGDSANTRGTNVALGQFRVNFDALFHATDDLDLSLAVTYFQGGVLPSDRVELASDLFYVERESSYRGVDTAAEVRFVPSSRFNVVAGLETVYDHESFGVPQRIRRDNDEPVAESASAGHSVDLVNYGAYAGSTLVVVERWLKLTGGVRYDQHSEYGGQLTGRAGITSRLTDTLVAKALYGSAFKAPSAHLLYAEPLRPGDVVGNPELRPQHIHTFEYQMSWKPSRFFGVTSGVAKSYLDDKAEFTPQGINLTARNVASQESLSWETRVDARRYEDVRTYASFELVHATRDLGQEGYAANLVGDENVVYPPWIGRAGVTFAVPSVPSVPLELGAEGRLVGPRRLSDTSIVERGESLTLPSYFVLDTSLATRDLYLVPGHETRVALRTKNLLLERGPDPGFSGFEYPLAPPEIYLEIGHTY